MLNPTSFVYNRLAAHENTLSFAGTGMLKLMVFDP